MNAQTKFFTAAAVTAIAGFVSAAPAQAITLGGPGLIQGDGSGVYFNFLESHGNFMSKWGVYNNTTGTFTTLFEESQSSDKNNVRLTDHKGTCGITVQDCQASFTFEEGNEYAFFLENMFQGGTITIFSADELNEPLRWTEFEGQTKFFSDLTILNDTRYGTDKSLESDLAFAVGETFSLENGMTALIAFEDQGKNILGDGKYVHPDWNDFLVTASVPEPATILGLGVVAGAMALYRLRKQDKAS